jgi:hypothetical protein
VREVCVVASPTDICTDLVLLSPQLFSLMWHQILRCVIPVVLGQLYKAYSVCIYIIYIYIYIYTFSQLTQQHQIRAICKIQLHVSAL